METKVKLTGNWIDRESIEKNSIVTVQYENKIFKKEGL